MDSSKELSLLRESWTETFDKLFVLFETIKKISFTSTTDSCLEQILFHAILFFEADYVSFLTLDNDKRELAVKIIKNKDTDTIDRASVRVPFGKGIAGSVAETGEPIFLNDIASGDPRIMEEKACCNDCEIKNIMAVPVLLLGKSIGVLEVINKGKGDFTLQDRDFVITIAFLIALSMTRSIPSPQLTAIPEAPQQNLPEPAVPVEEKSLHARSFNMFEDLPFGFLLINKNMEVLYANSYGVRMLGLGEQEFTMDSIAELLAKETELLSYVKTALQEDTVYKWKSLLLKTTSKFALFSTVMFKDGDPAHAGVGLLLSRPNFNVE